MNPDTSQARVKDLTVTREETSATLASTSRSRPLKSCPGTKVLSAACSHKMTRTTMAS